MAITGTPRMITDGLVLYLDAANTKSYPSSGTAWTDLSQTATSGSLTNGPTFSSTNGGGIVFDGTDDSVKISNQLLTGTGDFTINQWITADASLSSSYGTTFANYSSGSLSVLYGSSFMGLWLDNSASYVDTPRPFKSGSVMITSIRSGNITTFYQNGVLMKSGISTASIGTTNDFRLGQATTGGERFKGTIHTTAVYNRAISQSEIFQLYEATRERFGLGEIIPIEYLVVAGGGGGGGASGGGGGAGGLLSGSMYMDVSTLYRITIGAGGTLGIGRTSIATGGNTSSFISTSTLGGGRGGADDSSASEGTGMYKPGNGGSGGGAGYWSNFAGTTNITGSGTAGQGNPGGKRDSGQNGAGGGGASSAGTNTTTARNGHGGSGSLSTITGVATWYAGGGGGSGNNSSVYGLGGIGGGGSGDYYNGTVYVSGSHGESNTGGGGGGGLLHNKGYGGNGGSGIVILAYPTSYPSASVDAGLTFSYSTSSRTGFHVYRFTGGIGNIRI